MQEADEVISNALLIAMVLKGLTSDYDTFTTVITQRKKQITFVEFKGRLQSHKERAKAHGRDQGWGYCHNDEAKV